MKLKFLDYRYADAVLSHKDFDNAKAEIIGILEDAPVPLLDPEKVTAKGSGGVKRRKRKPLRGDHRDRYFFLPVDQKALNTHLDKAFKNAGWTLQPLIVNPRREGVPATGLKGDYKKGRLQVEVQLGNMARWYSDVFKFQLSYSLGEIDAAVLVVPTQHFANLIDENVAYFERVRRELPWAKMSLTLPIWVVGVEPKDYAPVQECYNRAAKVWEGSQGGNVVTIPYDVRIAEEPAEEDV